MLFLYINIYLSYGMQSQEKIIEQLEGEVLSLREKLYDAIREKAIVRKKFDDLKGIIDDMFPDKK